MDEQRTRIQEDLRGLVAGEVRCDDVFLQLYASDASLYQIKPLGVVRPRSAADVSACLRYAHTNLIPVHARGAGTGLSGESIGPGIVLDFSNHFRRILAHGPDWVQVQPGVVLERLNAYMAAYGRVFGPDPAMSHVTTMGSVVAIDAAGSKWLKYGSARNNVRQLRIVLADGTPLDVGREPLVGGVSQDPDPIKRDLVNQLAELLARHATSIAAHQPKSLVNRCGYELAGVLHEDHLDLSRLLTGSEGTLALFTEITFATHPLPKHLGTVLFLFESLENAARAVEEILPFHPIACDLMDRRHLNLARETDPHYASMIPATAEALLLVELESADPLELRERMRQLTERLRRRKRLAIESRTAFSRDDMDFSWRLAQKVVPTLYRLKGSTRALPFIEDIAIPPAALAGFLVEMQNVLKRHQVTASLFGHAGHGQLHIRPFLDLADPEHVKLMAALATDLYEAVFAVGGTISGEHGDGLSRTQFVERQFGDLYPVLREVKRIFDPQNILNPGKVIGDDPDLMTRNLRPAVAPVLLAERSIAADTPLEEEPALIPLELNWSTAELADVATSCNGCGACRRRTAQFACAQSFALLPPKRRRRAPKPI